jgi:hypothetical protein
MDVCDERLCSRKGGLRGHAWPGLWLASALAVAGCQAPAAPFDPFLAGRTTIPPPGTAVATTAAPAAAPYYNAGPPVVSVPGATTIYPPPGATPATVPTSALPPAASPRFPRGQTVPQAAAEKPKNNVELAGWQPADPSEVRVPAILSTEAQTEAKSKSGVVQASHEAPSRQTPSREPPLRIVAPDGE